MAKTCEFSDTDWEIKSQIIRGYLSTRLRVRDFRADIRLKELSYRALATELAEIQNSSIAKSNANIPVKLYQESVNNVPQKYFYK